MGGRRKAFRSIITFGRGLGRFGAGWGFAVGILWFLLKSANEIAFGFSGFGFGFVIGFGFGGGGVTLIGGLGLGLGFTTGLGFGCSTVGFGFGLTTGGFGLTTGGFDFTIGAGLGELCARVAEGGGVETN